MKLKNFEEVIQKLREVTEDTMCIGFFEGIFEVRLFDLENCTVYYNEEEKTYKADYDRFTKNEVVTTFYYEDLKQIVSVMDILNDNKEIIDNFMKGINYNGN